MKEPHGQPHNSYSDPDTTEDVIPLSSLQPEQQPELKASESQKDAPSTHHLKNPRKKFSDYTAIQRAVGIGNWVKRKASDVGIHDWLMVVFTGVLTIVAIQQFNFARVNSKSSTDQVNKIIEAANRIEDAADIFSGSAAHIDDGIHDAVGKLNIQAGALNKTAAQMSRLAKATETANANVIASDRPWVGGQIDIANFEAGKKATFTLTYTNSGKRPAIIDLTAARADFFTSFPADPRSEYFKAISTHGESPSKAVIVPGSWTKLTFTTETEVPAQLLEMTAQDPAPLKYFVFSTAEYRDLKTNEPHYTRVCFIYYPRAKGPSDSGFRNCQEYNDAK